MHASSLLPALAAVFFATANAASSYQLADSYTSANFDASWDFFSQADPTNGYLKYASSQAAQSSLLAGKTTSNNIYLGTQPGTNGRQSVRISSKKSYNYHLMVADIVHAPVGTGPAGSCGVWPALWELGGPDPWPAAGEIDIYEGVNAQLANTMTLHTNPGCTVQRTAGAFRGNMTTTDCNVSNGANGNAGCSVTAAGTANSNTTFGAGFNAQGGGVYATEVSAAGIKIWHFPRGAIPQDLQSTTSKTPDPSTWGTPLAAYAGACDIAQHFKNLQVVINTAFCGDWAGKAWHDAQNGGATPSCAALTGAATCDAYVAAHPEAFEQAYWEIKSVEVYTQQAAAKREEQQQQQEKDDVFSRVHGLRVQQRDSDSFDDVVGSVFVKPVGEAYDKCVRLTPGHCGDDRRSVTSDAPETSSSLALKALALVLIVHAFFL